MRAARTIAFFFLTFGGICALSLGQELKQFDADYLQLSARNPEWEPAVDAIVSLTNELRKEHSLGPLKVDKKLRRAAEYFAAYMAGTNKFSHDADGNRPADRVALFGYKACITAENIAYQEKPGGFKPAELAKLIVEGWKKSPEHLANMLDPDLTEIGVAVGHDPKSNRYYAVQVFGRPESAAIQFEVTNKTTEPLQYSVAEAGREKSPAKAFELPPGTSMHHMRCRSAVLDWGWTESADNVAAKSGRAYAITKSARGHQVAEQAMAE
jgi:hypothetical protein